MQAKTAARTAAGPENGEGLGSVCAAGNRLGLNAQWSSSATAMPDTRPLRPITHWRSGNPAIETAFVLKSQPFR